MEYLAKSDSHPTNEARNGKRVGETPAHDELTAQEAIFCQWYAEERSLFKSFAQAYPQQVVDNRRTTWAKASEVFRRPHVQRRIVELQDLLDSRIAARLGAIMQDLQDIADADPNDLVRLERYNCRHCHGVDFKWQWADAMELARALDQYRTALADYRDRKHQGVKGKELGKPPRQPADASGGYGFALKDDPHPACPSCYGQGYARTSVCDTTKLDPRTRKLYKGVEEKADGTIKVLMHDQMQARDMLVKMMGGYKDGKQPGSVTPGTDLIPETASAEEAQRAYMRLISRV